LNAPNKRYTLIEWTQIQDLYICCLQGTQLRPRNAYRLKVIQWKKVFHASSKSQDSIPNHKKAGVAILTWKKIDFEVKTVKIDKDIHNIVIKESIQLEYIKIINLYGPNIGSPQYKRQILTTIKREINSNIIILGHFNTQLSPISRSSKQKIIF